MCLSCNVVSEDAAAVVLLVASQRPSTRDNDIKTNFIVTFDHELMEAREDEIRRWVMEHPPVLRLKLDYD